MMNIRAPHPFFSANNAHDQAYWQRFYHLITLYTHVEAYEKTEEWYLKEYGVNRFSSYESFKVGKHRHRKAQIKG